MTAREKYERAMALYLRAKKRGNPLLIERCRAHMDIYVQDALQEHRKSPFKNLFVRL